jgi:hypothetical protein
MPFRFTKAPEGWNLCSPGRGGVIFGKYLAQRFISCKHFHQCSPFRGSGGWNADDTDCPGNNGLLLPYDRWPFRFTTAPEGRNLCSPGRGGAICGKYVAQRFISCKHFHQCSPFRGAGGTNVPPLGGQGVPMFPL